MGPLSRQFAALRSALILACILIAPVVAGAEQLPLKYYTSANGLPHNHVQQIFQDSRGFLWFCTALGLSRFDGYRFTNYGEEQGLQPSLINDLLESRNGTYWIATNGSGIYRLNLQPAPPARTSEATAYGAGLLFTHISVGDEPASNRVNRLYEDREGQIWAGTDAGLFRLDESVGRFAQVNLGVPGQAERTVQVWSFVEDLEGCLWIATKFGLFRRLPDGSLIYHWIRASQGRDQIYPMLKDGDGRLWIGHESVGLVVFRPMPISSSPKGGTRPWMKLRANAEESMSGPAGLPEAPGEALLFTTADGLATHNLYALTQDRYGRVWAAGVGGMAVLEQGHFRNYTTAQGLSNDLVTCLREDRDGNLWIGTGTGGAMRLARNGFITYLAKDGLGHEFTYSILENRAAQRFAVSREGFLNRLGDGRITAVKPNLVAGPRGDLRDALEDSRGEWWFATVHGLYRFPRVQKIEQLATLSPKAVYTTKDGLADNDVRRIYEDSRGDIWINRFSTGSEVLTRWERASAKFYHYSDRDGLEPFHSAWSFCEDRSGQVWIGFRDGPLARYSDGRFTTFTTADGVPEGTITDLYVDSRGRLWLASNRGGLGLIEDPSAHNPRFTRYTTAQGLASNSIECIVEDGDGRIYLGTAQGIDRLNPATNLIKHYALNEGVISLPVGAIRDLQGALWFSTQKGVSVLIPQPDEAQPVPVTLIGGLRISGVAQPVSELGQTEVTGLELGPDQNHIQIDFFGLSISQGEALRYQFKIESLDADWGAPTDQRSVNLSLTPGAYRFLVRAVSPDGSVSSAPALVAFKILPPIWQRWWFRTVAALALIISLMAFARYRATRLKALRESENRFRALAETASDAIFAVDEQGKVIFVNPAAEKVFGYGREEVIARDLARLIPRYVRALHMAGFGDEASLDISWDAREVRGFNKNGHEIPLELSFGEFTRNGKRYFTIIARDVTERKRAEEALRKSREERLIELEQVMRRIATDLHDDIGSTLSQINLLSEVVRQKVRDDARVSEPLSMISNASHELVSSMSDIVWAINPQKDHLSDLVHRMRRFASDTLTARDITFHFSAPDDAEDIKMGANIRREVFLIFKEAVNNLARHSGCSLAEIEFKTTGGTLFLKVRDNGNGFDLSEESNGHGLMSIRDRASAIGGELEVRSVEGHGTLVILKVAMTRAAAAS